MVKAISYSFEHPPEKGRINQY